MADKVLVVDDEPEARQLIRVFLSLYSNIDEVIMADNGKKALEFFDEDRPDIKAVFTDINMPYMDGYSLIKALRERNYKGKIVQISAIAPDQKLAERADYFLEKPIKATDFDEIMSKMGYCLKPREKSNISY